MEKIIYIWGNLIEDNQSILYPQTVIETLEKITCIAWSPVATKLAICTNNDKLYLWSEQSILSIENPNDYRFNVKALKWSPDGKTLLLMNRTQMMVVFV